MKYSDFIAKTLKELGFTHFFFVGGGNIMHLTGSLAEYLTPVPVIHEVAAVIGSEYFNKVSDENRAIALVTAGPGVTNAITGIAGAYLECRPTLILGGQVKTSDLKSGEIRQRGIQEIDGVSICRPITKHAVRLKAPVGKNDLRELFEFPFNGKQGPVFVELPLDVQGSHANSEATKMLDLHSKDATIEESKITRIAKKINQSKRPVFLLGGGAKRQAVGDLVLMCQKSSIPIATTWNGADLVRSDHSNYIGRPNTWGQRSSNIIIQQSDLVIAVGTRLGLQQTGFNWQQFVPNGQVVMVDIDEEEIKKGHPKIDEAIVCDSGAFLEMLTPLVNGNWDEWMEFARSIRTNFPLNEEKNNFVPPEGFVQPFKFVEWLSHHSDEDAVIVPCSSGSAFTCMMQAFCQRSNQRMVTNKGLASMGYGLSGAIGASLASAGKKTYLVEGDGGFAQNIQELGTVAILKLNLKIFIFEDQGHASIRMTQRNYFGGKYIGCDLTTGLGLPKWEKIGEVWGIETMCIYDLALLETEQSLAMLDSNGPAIFIVRIHPDQTYYPKIASRITEDGGMESNPIHLMSPELSDEENLKAFKYLEI